ncbi:N-acetylmannosamine-6-phosphate 2-epimerase, partial [Escherichia coli]|nr:N-acetylmannosamine-6-phosphate 2-epimerase [Escherichia coli]
VTRPQEITTRFTNEIQKIQEERGK